MRLKSGRFIRLFGPIALAAIALPIVPASAQAPAKPAASVTSRRVIDPAAPILPAAVVNAMQEGRYQSAVAGLERIAGTAKTDDEKAYYAFVTGIAQRLDGRAAEARATLQNELSARPKSMWGSKIRFELAAIELAAGRFAAAEAIARAETETLLAGTRKDRLAEVYYAYARRMLRPDDPISRPDPANAHPLLVQARQLAKSETLRAKLLFEQAQASRAMGPAGLGNAINEFGQYIREHKNGEDRPAASFHLGEAQLAAGQRLPARLTWTDLAAELSRPPLSAHPRAGELRAKSLYLIAATYAIPNPPDDTQLNLGIAALKRYLAAYPSHEWAVRGAYEIGLSHAGRGRSQEAIDAFTEFLKGTSYKAETDEAKRDLAALSMNATYQIAQILQSQEKFTEAIDAYKGYLAKFPNGPQSADAQRQILEAQLAIADKKLEQRQFAEARADWNAFANRNPLDGRVPQLLYRIGESFVTEEKYDEAIGAWDPLLSRFPNTEPSAHAQFVIATIYEDHKGNPTEAIDRFRKITVDPWRTQALTRVSVMESKTLTVTTPRVFRSGETPHLKISTRNLETLTFTAYKLNAEAYFRKKQLMGNIETLDVGLVAPDAEWTIPVKDYGKYKPVDTTYDLKIQVPGIYVVKVTDEKSLQATTLVVGSDLDAIVKASKDQILVFAQDMKTGKGRPNARVLISDGKTMIAEKTTGPDGVLLMNWDKPQNPLGHFWYLVLDGKDAAGSTLGLPGTVAQGLSPRAYIYTDRPAYRPGNTVSFRGVVREVAESRYVSPENQVYRLETFDSRGRMIASRNVTLSKFGTFSDSIELDSAAPVGNYRVRLYQPGRSDFSTMFLVQSYRLEKMDLSFDLPRTVFFRGETIKGEVTAKFQYGAPVAGRLIQVVLPDGRTVEGRTDDAGKFKVEFPTEGFAEEQTLSIVARLPMDNVQVAAAVTLAVRAFRIDLATSRDVYLDGESFQLKASTFDAQGDPIGQPLKLSVLKRVEKLGRTSEVEVSSAVLTTDEKTGSGTRSLKVDDKDGGTFVVRASGVDRFGNAVVADRVLTISGGKDETKLRILADRQSFKVGETAKVVLHARAKPGTALLAWEADRILSYRIVQLKEGENDLSWLVEGGQFPNFTLTASRMVEERFDAASLDVKVERDLRVTIAPVKPSVGPGEETEFDVTTVDQLGNPVAAELSVALIDNSLLRLFGDRSPNIGAFFYSQTRTGSFETESTNTFSYTTQTRPVEEALVEEQAREQALAANAALGAQIRDRAQSQVLNAPGAPPTPVYVNSAPAPAPMMAPAESGGMPGMMGGMGGGGFGGPAGSAGRPASASDKVADAEGMPELAKKMEDAGRPQIAAKRKAGAPRGIADEAAPREQFIETAYWNPAVVTDATGKARVKFRAPQAMSAYRFTAKGTTGSDTLVGQATADLVVKKDFFVDLKTPSLLTQGDRPRFIGQVHHVGVRGKAEVSLATYAGGRQNLILRSIDIKNDGVTEVSFDPFEVPDGEVVQLTIKAKVGEVTDELVMSVPIKPWGTQAVASASGSSSDGATVFVGLPNGRTYESPEMLVVLSPTARRMLIELALGRDAYVLPSRFDRCIFPPTDNTAADRAGELLGLCSVLEHLSAVKGDLPPDAARLSSRAREIVSELVTLQNDDGSWPWIAPRKHQNSPGDPLTSARAAFALRKAATNGLLSDPSCLDRAANYLAAQFGRAGSGDQEARSAILHALAVNNRASFELANSLNRVRQGLNDVSLAYLALTMVELDRAPLANEILDLLATRARTETVGPGKPTRKFWQGAGQYWHQTAETTALASLAFAKGRPQASEVAASVEWLLAHRGGTGWNPTKAKGPALAAISLYQSRSAAAEDRYRLTVTVNDQEVYQAAVDGATEGKAIVVPRRFIKPGEANRVKFDVNGRGTFAYAVTMTGFTRDFAPDQQVEGKRYVVNDRLYLHANPELDGRALPVGFSTVVNARAFANKVTQVGAGGRARVQISVYRDEPANLPAWERPALVVEETLPAGVTLIEDSIQAGNAIHEAGENSISFYFGPNDYPGTIEYEVFGYLPGTYKSLPTRIRDAHDSGRYHLGQPGELKVLAPGEPETDPYKATPDELFARGSSYFNSGRLTDAAAPLEEILGGYTLREDILKQVARMLLTIHCKEYQPRKVVQDFEILKEKAPDLVIPFEEILVVGRAYRDINEHERAYLVWRAITEASYLEDAQVGEILRRRGKSLDSVAYLISLWREYPNSASIETDFFGLSQVLVERATRAINDPSVRKELADAGVTRSELLLQSIRLIQVLLSQSPKNPLADEASLGLVGAFLELEDYATIVTLSNRFAKLYPKSKFLDSFLFSEALGNFNLGKYDQAIELAEKISKAVYKDANGVDQPSPNKWQAIYILGQIHDARRQPAKAVNYYQEVADKFTDAAGSLRSWTRKDLKVPEISLVRLDKSGPRVGLNNLPPEASTKPEVKLDYRNIAEADVKVYPVDLMRLYLTRRNLDAIAGIDLAGITPLHESTVKLGDGKDFADKVRAIDVPITKEGAYLVMIRGGELYASGIMLVSPLEVEVMEEAESGRVRVTVRDAKTKDAVPKVQVKVIGTGNPTFISGQTDLRGVFVAEGVRGVVTAVARRDSAQYAFYRGKTPVGTPPPAAAPMRGRRVMEQKQDAPQQPQSLDNNLKSLNTDNYNRQIQRMNSRFQAKPGGVISSDAY